MSLICKKVMSKIETNFANFSDPKLADKGHKSASKSHAKPPCESYPAQKKPFTGKLFYLDLPSNRRAETLENDIKRFGGVSEYLFTSVSI